MWLQDRRWLEWLVRLGMARKEGKEEHGGRTTAVGGHSSCAGEVVLVEASLLHALLGHDIAGCKEDLFGSVYPPVMLRLLLLHVRQSRRSIIATPLWLYPRSSCFNVAPRTFGNRVVGIRNGRPRSLLGKGSRTAVVTLCVSSGALLSFAWYLVHRSVNFVSFFPLATHSLGRLTT